MTRQIAAFSAASKRAFVRMLRASRGTIWAERTRDARMMSIVRNWVHGISIFVLMTASFVIAMSIAITGPPTENELNAAQRALGALARGAGAGIRAAGDSACAALPEDVSDALLCPVTQTAPPAPPARMQAAAQAPVVVPEPPPPPEAHAQAASEPLAEAEHALLGSTAGDPPAARRVDPAPRRARATSRARPQRGQRGAVAPRDLPGPPLQVAPRSAAALDAGEEPALASIRPMAPVVLHHPAPSQEQQPAVQGEEGYADEAPSWRDADGDDRRWRRWRRWRERQYQDAEADDREADELPPDEEWY